MLELSLCVAVVVADQITKFLVHQNLGLGEQIVVIPAFFSISHVQNTGAAWGIFSDHTSWLVVFSGIMLAVIVIFRKTLIGSYRLNRVAAGLMVGGITGNLIDRLKWDYVIDFLHFYGRSWEYPSFNIADSAICVGVGLYMIGQLVQERKLKRERAQARQAERKASHDEFCPEERR